MAIYSLKLAQREKTHWYNCIKKELPWCVNSSCVKMITTIIRIKMDGSLGAYPTKQN